MLSKINNSNYYPSFGVMKISRNRRTVSALKKCSKKTIDNIDKAGQLLANDNGILTGVIKKAGQMLVLTVKFPKGFVCPEKISLQNLKRTRNPFFREYIVKDGISDGCIYNNKEGDIDKQNCTDGIEVNFDYSYIETAARELHELNNKLQEHANNGGVLFPTAKQKGKMKFTQKQQNSQEKLIQNLLSKY